MNTKTHTAAAAPAAGIDLAAAALAELAASAEVTALLEKLTVAQRATDDDGSWNSPTGHRVEAAMGHLRMALEAAGRTF